MRRHTIATTLTATLFTAIVIAGLQGRVYAFYHCEVPCGVYDDYARLTRMLEDATTIGRAVEKLAGAAGNDDVQSINQMVRWVNTKETHATHIQETIAQYFLNQRVKPAARGSRGWDPYVTRLTGHHVVMVAAMRCKQASDPARVEELRIAIEALAPYYPAPHDHDH